jgi:hypothetical protein
VLRVVPTMTLPMQSRWSTPLLPASLPRPSS